MPNGRQRREWATRVLAVLGYSLLCLIRKARSCREILPIPSLVLQSAQRRLGDCVPRKPNTWGEGGTESWSLLGTGSCAVAWH